MAKCGLVRVPEVRCAKVTSVCRGGAACVVCRVVQVSGAVLRVVAGRVLCARGSVSRWRAGMGETGGRARAGWECVWLGLVGVCMCVGVGEGVRAVQAGVRGWGSPPSPYENYIFIYIVRRL